MQKKILFRAGPTWMRRGSATRAHAAPTRRNIYIYIL